MSHDDEMDKAKTDHEQITRPGEQVSRDEQEAGRRETETDPETGRRSGESTMRDVTGVDPKEPITTDGRSQG